MDATVNFVLEETERLTLSLSAPRIFGINRWWEMSDIHEKANPGRRVGWSMLSVLLLIARRHPR